MDKCTNWMGMRIVDVPLFIQTSSRKSYCYIYLIYLNTYVAGQNVEFLGILTGIRIIPWWASLREEETFELRDFSIRMITEKLNIQSTICFHGNQFPNAKARPIHNCPHQRMWIATRLHNVTVGIHGFIFVAIGAIDFFEIANFVIQEIKEIISSCFDISTA